MRDLIVRLKSYGACNIGFALFLAWNYMALYGCGMVAGSFAPYSLEYIWIVAGASEVAWALIGLAIARRAPFCRSKAWGVAAAACAVLGNFALWIGYAMASLYWSTFILAGMFLGASVAIMTAVWGARLAACDFSKIEFDVLASFALAFALHLLVFPIRLGGLADLAVASSCAVASMYFAFRKPRLQCEGEVSCPVGEGPRAAAAPESNGRMRTDPDFEMRQSFSTLAMVAMLWLLVAYFRVILSPVGSYDRLQHYFLPFLIAFVVTVALFAVLVKWARYLSITLAFRWAVPFVVLGFGVICFDYADPANYIAAYTLNFIGMFGMQISCWMALAKYIRRRGRPAQSVFLGFAVSEGAGILAGCGVGLFVAAHIGGIERLGVSLAVLAAALFVIMAAGFNPYWRLDVRTRRALEREFAFRAEDLSESEEGEEAAGADEDRLAVLFHAKALAIQRDFGLTGRETEITELLLAGRSRPYIRDELVISLNTVHSHVSNIFSKCGVHSQQELIDLAHRG